MAFVLQLVVLAFVAAASSLVGQSYTIQVCQNKDCCQRFQGKACNLVETMEMMLDRAKDVTVETSGCLSQCGHGPNIQVGNNDGIFHHRVETATSVAAVFADDFEVHPTILAAVNVMEKAANARSTDTKLSYLDSVITALQKKPELLDSKTMAHALALRAQVLLDKQEFALAKQDAADATKKNPAHRTAWRSLAEAEEQDKNVEGAIAALQNWSKTNPRFATKVRNEISRLQLVAAASGG